MFQPSIDPPMVRFPYERLGRWPDPEAANLFAVDAADRLLIDTAAPAIAKATPGTVAVVGDRYGALVLASAVLGAQDVRSHQDSFSSQMALDANYRSLRDELGLGLAPYQNLELDESLFARAEVVLMQLPKDLKQLEQWVALVAASASPTVCLFAGGRDKHMNRGMNRVLERHFHSVSVSRARQKSRVLVASEPRRDAPAAPSLDEYFDPQTDLWVCSVPGSFASGRIDEGTRFLIPFIEEMQIDSLGDNPLVADLGCGTGVLSSVLLRSHPSIRVIAVDRSRAAVVSATATLSRNAPGGSWDVVQGHALSSVAEASLDAVVCNPPFHSEAAISTELSRILFTDASRALRIGGQMLTVFNSHLPHRRALERLVGPTKQLGRNSRFTVTASTRRP